jgi:hypothetical protein
MEAFTTVKDYIQINQTEMLHHLNVVLKVGGNEKQCGSAREPKYNIK